MPPSISFFAPGSPTGKRVAIIGRWPCRSSLTRTSFARRGHEIGGFRKPRDVPGGLNTLGIAAYKISTEFALTEVEQVTENGY